MTVKLSVLGRHDEVYQISCVVPNGYGYIQGKVFYDMLEKEMGIKEEKTTQDREPNLLRSDPRSMCFLLQGSGCI